MNMFIVHKYMITNKYNISYLTDTSFNDFKKIINDLKNKFTKKKLIEDYSNYINSL